MNEILYQIDLDSQINNVILAPSFDLEDRPLIFGEDISQMIDIRKSGA